LSGPLSYKILGYTLLRRNICNVTVTLSSLQVKKCQHSILTRALKIQELRLLRQAYFFIDTLITGQNTTGPLIMSDAFDAFDVSLTSWRPFWPPFGSFHLQD
jgi:hypothetical protein